MKIIVTFIIPCGRISPAIRHGLAGEAMPNILPLSKDKRLSCIFTAHPIVLIPFPAQHPVFLGQERGFLVLTGRSLLTPNADFLLGSPYSPLCCEMSLFFI